MSLRSWFIRYGFLPLAAVFAVTTIAMAVLLFQTVSESMNRREQVIAQVAELTGMGVVQRNRVVLESAVGLAIDQARVSQIRVCESGTVVLSYPKSETRCSARSESHWEVVDRRSPTGLRQVQLILVLPRFPHLHRLTFFLTTYVLLITLSLLILVRLRSRLNKDILAPFGMICPENLDRLPANSQAEPQTTHLISPTVEISPIIEIDLYLQRQKENEKLRAQSAANEALVTLASQVSHDIRSPVTALKTISQIATDLPEQQRIMMRSAIQRINEITNSLLSKVKSQASASSIAESPKRPEAKMGNEPGRQELRPLCMSALIEEVVAEKRLEYYDRPNMTFKCDFDRYDVFVRVNKAAYSRVLSNLINNSAEALFGPGQITLSLRSFSGEVSISVSDSGHGMPPEILKRVGERGLTFGKGHSSSGSGLGLYHARKSVEEFGGRFIVQSKLGEGTQVSMNFPRSPSPAWSVHGVDLIGVERLVIVDDDRSIHDMWRSRLVPVHSDSDVDTDTDTDTEYGSMCKVMAFTGADEFRHWMLADSNTGLNSLFLIDYELRGSKQTGLDLIQEFSLGRHAILVTSRYDDPSVESGVSGAGAKLLAKSLVGSIRILR